MMSPSASAAVTKEPSMYNSRYTEDGKAPLAAPHTDTGGKRPERAAVLVVVTRCTGSCVLQQMSGVAGLQFVAYLNDHSGLTVGQYAAPTCGTAVIDKHSKRGAACRLRPKLPAC